MRSFRSVTVLENTTPHCSRGISLIEILITMVIVSIGLLGLAGLQSASLKFNNMASLKTIAIIQSYDLMDRMRANNKGLSEGAYDNPTATASSSCYTISGCSAQAMANDDFKVWDDLNAALLPDGKGFVCRESTPDTGINRVNASSTDDTPNCAGGTRHVIYLTWTEDSKTVTFSQTMDR